MVFDGPNGYLFTIEIINIFMYPRIDLANHTYTKLLSNLDLIKVGGHEIYIDGSIHFCMDFLPSIFIMMIARSYSCKPNMDESYRLQFTSWSTWLSSVVTNGSTDENPCFLSMVQYWQALELAKLHKRPSIE